MPDWYPAVGWKKQRRRIFFGSRSVWVVWGWSTRSKEGGRNKLISDQSPQFNGGKKKRTHKRRKNCQLRKELKSKKKEIENKRMFHEEARGTVGTQQKKEKKKRRGVEWGGGCHHKQYQLTILHRFRGLRTETTEEYEGDTQREHSLPIFNGNTNQS